MRLGGGTHGKAATKQRQGWAECGFRHFLKLIIHAGPSLLFFYPLICPSVFLSSSVCPTPPPLPLTDGLRLSFEHCTFHNWDSVPITLCSPLPTKRRSFSHFVPERPWLQHRLRDFAHSSWFNQTQNVLVSSLSETPQLKLTLRQT